MKARVSWDYFMRRRNISYSSLIGMDYERYAAWCHTRYVIPLDQKEYESNVAPFKKAAKPVTLKEVQPVVPSTPTRPDAKTLNRKKKSDLVELCETYGITIDGKETKKQLVSLILGVNND